MSKQRVLITGSSGLVGSEIANEFERQYTVYRLSRGYLELPNEVKVRIEQASDVKKYIKEVDVVVHCAAQSTVWRSWSDIEKTLDDNIGYSVQVAKLAIALRCKQFVNFSSEAVYGNLKYPIEGSTHAPTSPYGVSKSAADKLIGLILENKINLITVVPAFVIGPSMERNILFDVYSNVKKKKVNINCSEDSKFSFLPVTAIVSQVDKLINEHFTGLFHIPGYESSIGSLISQLNHKLDLKIDVNFEGPLRVCALRSKFEQQHKWALEDIQVVVSEFLHANTNL